MEGPKSHEFLRKLQRRVHATLATLRQRETPSTPSPWTRIADALEASLPARKDARGWRKTAQAVEEAARAVRDHYNAAQFEACVKLLQERGLLPAALLPPAGELAPVAAECAQQIRPDDALHEPLWSLLMHVAEDAYGVPTVGTTTDPGAMDADRPAAVEDGSEGAKDGDASDLQGAVPAAAPETATAAADTERVEEEPAALNFDQLRDMVRHNVADLKKREIRQKEALLALSDNMDNILLSLEIILGMERVPKKVRDMPGWTGSAFSGPLRAALPPPVTTADPGISRMVQAEGESREAFQQRQAAALETYIRELDASAWQPILELLLPFAARLQDAVETRSVKALVDMVEEGAAAAGYVLTPLMKEELHVVMIMLNTTPQTAQQFWRLIDAVAQPLSMYDMLAGMDPHIIDSFQSIIVECESVREMYDMVYGNGQPSIERAMRAMQEVAARLDGPAKQSLMALTGTAGGPLPFYRRLTKTLGSSPQITGLMQQMENKVNEAVAAGGIGDVAAMAGVAPPGNGGGSSSAAPSGAAGGAGGADQHIGSAPSAMNLAEIMAALPPEARAQLSQMQQLLQGSLREETKEEQ